MLLNEFIYRFKRKTKLYFKWLITFIISLFIRKRFKNISYFCTFVGYARSGHTLIASLLDAHPNMVFGIEMDTIQYYKLGFNRDQIIYLLIKNSNEFTEIRKNIWTDYSYKVIDAHQGSYVQLNIIGDKYGSQNTRWLKENIDIFNAFSEKINIPLKLIHVIRNPFDTIATMFMREREKKDITDLSNLELLNKIYIYFNLVKVIDRIRREKIYDIFDLYHEEFIKNPYQGLNDLVRFLGESATDEYLTKCSKIVYDKPHRSRFEISWPPEIVKFVENMIKDYDFLQKYSYS